MIKARTTLPKLLCVVKFPASFDHRLLIITSLIKQGLVPRHFHSKLPHRSHNHLSYAREGAPTGPLVPVQPRAAEEAPDSYGHCRCRNAEAPAPADVGLYPDEHRGGDEGPDVDGEVEPVEEGALLLLLGLVGVVELVGAEGRHAGLDPARAEGYEVEAAEEGGGLGACDVAVAIFIAEVA